MKCVGNEYAYTPKDVAREAEVQRRLVRSKIVSNAPTRSLLPSGGSVYLHHFVTFCSKALFFAEDQTDNPLASQIFYHFPRCEHLQLAVNALAAGDLQRKQTGHDEKFFGFYGRAVRKLNDAISVSLSSGSVAIILSVLLLGFCEVGQPETTFPWHIPAHSFTRFQAPTARHGSVIFKGLEICSCSVEGQAKSLYLPASSPSLMLDLASCLGENPCFRWTI